MRVERVGLEHHGDAASRGRQMVDRRAADDDTARVLPFEPRDDAQQSRLTAAGRAKKRNEGTCRDVEVDTAQHLRGPEGLC